MAIKYVYGVCTNTDDGEGNMCPLCKSKERQRILETDDFVCRQCHEELTKVAAPKPLLAKLKWQLIIAGVAAVIGIILALVFSGGKEEPKATSEPPTQIGLNHYEKKLKVGGTDKLEVTNMPEGATVEFTASTNKQFDAVSVDDDGVVTAEKEGTGKVRVIVLGSDKTQLLKTQCVYTVVKGKEAKEDSLAQDTLAKVQPQAQPTQLTLDKTKMALKVGGKVKLNLIAATKDGNKSPAAVSWTSSNPKVVTVDNNGNVVAKAAGTATITVQSALKSDAASPATCVVTVEKAKTGTSLYTGHGTKNLGYGIYRGDLKNGLPHGHGVITYTRQHRIVSSKDFVANPGDRFEGDFRDGRIESIGYWYHDGQQTGVKP